MAGKLKGLDPKQFFVNHGEKVGFGVVLVLVVLGLYGTDWAAYDKEPEDITEKVEVAEAALAVANWQTDESLAEERAEYELAESERPSHVVTAYLTDDIEWTPFMPSQRMTKSIVEIDRPLKEPDLMTVEGLFASAARVFVELAPEDLDLATDEDGEDVVDAEADAIADEDLPDEFRERRAGTGVGGSMAGYNDFGGEPDYESMFAPELEMEDMYGGYAGDEADFVRRRFLGNVWRGSGLQSARQGVSLRFHPRGLPLQESDLSLYGRNSPRLRGRRAGVSDHRFQTRTAGTGHWWEANGQAGNWWTFRSSAT